LPSLHHAIPAFELFMMAWEKMQQSNPHMAPFIDAGLKKANSYYNWMDNMKAYVVSMCEFPYLSLRFCWICTHWSWDWVVQAKETVIVLMEEYHHLKVPEQAVTQSSTLPGLLDALTQQFNIGNMALSLATQGGQQSVQEEYQSYINGGCVSETTDPLKFWEVWVCCCHS
ncbi:hypothetical protein PISMIDRAFT_102909, partial [Pisolithus microcarpus 441]